MRTHQSIIDDLVQFEEDFNSQTKKLRSGGVGYLRPDQILDHLTVIKKAALCIPGLYSIAITMWPIALIHAYQAHQKSQTIERKQDQMG